MMQNKYSAKKRFLLAIQAYAHMENIAMCAAIMYVRSEHMVSVVIILLDEKLR